ncbi:MAG: DMT family transporter [Planctomycetota bacterium]
MLRSLNSSASATRNPALPYLWMLSGAMAFALMGTIAHALGYVCDWQIIAFAPLEHGPHPLRLAGEAGGGSTVLLALTGALATLHPGERQHDLYLLPPDAPSGRRRPNVNEHVSHLDRVTLSGPLLKEWPNGEVFLAVTKRGDRSRVYSTTPFRGREFCVPAALGSSFATAISMLGLHRLQSVDPRAIVFHFSAVAIVFCAFSWLIFEHPLPMANAVEPWNLIRLLGVGTLAATGQLFLTRAFAWGSPARVSVVGLTQIPMAMILDMILFGRSFSFLTIVGIVMVVAPTARLLLSKAN